MLHVMTCPSRAPVRALSQLEALSHYILPAYVSLLSYLIQAWAQPAPTDESKSSAWSMALPKMTLSSLLCTLWLDFLLPPIFCFFFSSLRFIYSYLEGRFMKKSQDGERSHLPLYFTSMNLMFVPLVRKEGAQTETFSATARQVSRSPHDNESLLNQ